MKFLQFSSDGGKKSGVKGFFIVEIKSLISIVILKFNKGSRENYHSHAFNALTWFLKGKMTEHNLNGDNKAYARSFKPKITLKSDIHKVYADEESYAISIRGPWDTVWKEFNPRTKEFIILTHGRKEIGRE